MCTQIALTRETAIRLIHVQDHNQERVPDEKPRMVQLVRAVNLVRGIEPTRLFPPSPSITNILKEAGNYWPRIH